MAIPFSYTDYPGTQVVFGLGIDAVYFGLIWLDLTRTFWVLISASPLYSPPIIRSIVGMVFCAIGTIRVCCCVFSLFSPHPYHPCHPRRTLSFVHDCRTGKMSCLTPERFLILRPGDSDGGIHPELEVSATFRSQRHNVVMGAPISYSTEMRAWYR